MKIFIDTSAWVSLENKKDIHYKEAIAFKDEIKNKRYRLYTSNFVLDETYTLLLANVGYKKTIESIKRIAALRNKGLLHVIKVTEDIEDPRCLYLRDLIKTNFGLLQIAQARQ